MPSKKPWSDDWKIVGEQIGGGGQGTTFQVQAVADKTIACMKVLNDQKSEERRGRFRQECVAVETLSHPSIPKYITCNSERFHSDDRLFLVTEFITGQSLTKQVEQCPFGERDALGFADSLLEILEYVHSRDLVHRDIKPDNILLRNGDVLSPVVVDFGLSFNAEYTAISTASLQQLGNRFLHLPELQLDSSNKRNPISDVTQTCGILFFVLTGLPPVVLLDDQGRMPHQRTIPRNALNRLENVDAILSVFDRGFRQPTAERWQSARQLRDRLESVRQTESDKSIKLTKDLAANLRVRPEYSQRKRNDEVLAAFHKFARATVASTLREIEGRPISLGWNCRGHMGARAHTAHTCVFYLTLQYFSECKAELYVTGDIVCDEIVVTCSPLEHPAYNRPSRGRSDFGDIPPPRELGRVTIASNLDWQDVARKLRDEVLRTIEKDLYQALRTR